VVRHLPKMIWKCQMSDCYNLLCIRMYMMCVIIWLGIHFRHLLHLIIIQRVNHLLTTSFILALLIIVFGLEITRYGDILLTESISVCKATQVKYLFLVHPSIRNWPGHQAFLKKFSNWDSTSIFIIAYDFYYAYFPSFYTYLIAILCVCVCISCHNVSVIIPLSVCYHLA